jgi:DNA-directed RNA polymerase-4 subunit 1
MIWPVFLTYCINLGLFTEQKEGAKRYPSVIFKTLKSPRIVLSRKKFQRNPTVMDKVSIAAEVADRVTKNKGSPEVLPRDYWDFLPHHQPPQSNTTKILLSPHQVSIHNY